MILRWLYEHRGEHSVSGRQISCCRGLSVRNLITMRKGERGRGSLVSISEGGIEYVKTKGLV
jgi:hypothetical protein